MILMRMENMSSMIDIIKCYNILKSSKTSSA